MRPLTAFLRAPHASIRTLVAVLVAALLLGACAGPSTGGPSGDPALPDQLATATAGTDSFVHLQALQTIAERNGGTRALGTPGYDQSVQYVAETLRRVGFQVDTPTFSAESEDGGSVVTRNVIAQTTTGNPREVVLAGAHLDSVPGSPGINDNGSGVAAQLEIALELGSAPATTNAVRFVFFGAEEAGLRGSEYYVDTLPDDQRRDIALMFNSDILASPNAGYFVYDGDNSDGENITPGPAGSDVIERVLTERLATLGVQARGAGFYDASDYSAFVNAGIPTGGVYSGDAGIKSPEQAALWGGQAGSPFDPCYHQACDTIANINRDVLGRMTDALAFGVGTFANDLQGLPSREERG
jgi:aminopeptidase S